FCGSFGFLSADRLRWRGGAEAFDSRAGTVWARPPSGDCRRTRAAPDRAAVARAPHCPGDARSPRLLARQLCRRQSRDEGPLSASPLAGQPDQGAGHAAREAARRIVKSVTVHLTAPSPRGSKPSLSIHPSTPLSCNSARSRSGTLRCDLPALVSPDEAL